MTVESHSQPPSSEPVIYVSRGNSYQAMPLFRAILRKEFVGQYRRSWLGSLWSLLVPLAYVGIFIFLRLLFGISTGNTPYVLFILCGISCWFLFQKSVDQGYTVLTSNGDILKKLPIPPYIFPVVAVMLAALNFSFFYCILWVLMFFYGIDVSWTVILSLPVAALIAAFGYCASLLVISLAMYSRDIVHFLPIILQITMLMSPVFYPATNIPERYWPIYFLNPFGGLVETFRNVLVDGRLPYPSVILPTLLVASVISALGIYLFRKKSPYFTDVL